MALAVGLTLGAVPAAAQDYPNRPIKFLQGFAPGGNADIISRVVGEEMSKSLGQPVINESRAGAGGNLASEMTAKAAPDGYTIVLLTTGHVISPALYKSLPFDPVKDFEFVSTVSDFPFFIVVNAESRFKTIGDLVAAAREKPGAVTVGTAGIGTGQHMCSELFASSVGTKFVHVPFRGDSGAVTALLSGNIDFIIAPGTAIFSNIEAGKFRALALSGAERWPALPNVPTIGETAVPGFEVMAWVGVATTHGVPQPIVERLSKEVRQALAVPAVRDRLRALGGVARGSTPEQMRERAIAQVARWKEVAEKAGLERQ
jgi:tripartite-type tricarboxylate transporter receptor subunit TctC